MEGILSGNPLFIDDTNGDFRLDAKSPCINKGTNFFVWEEDTLINLDTLDYVGSAPDLGAYEYPLIISINQAEYLINHYQLNQNYPNPFNPTTFISWQLAVNSHVDLSIYNLLGQKICTLISENQKAGNHNIEWNASGFASGIYLCQLKIGDQIKTRKMILLK